MSKRDEYIEAMKNQLAELHKQVRELEKKGEAAQAEFTEKHKEQIAQVRGHYNAALSKIHEIKSASEDTGESL